MDDNTRASLLSKSLISLNMSSKTPDLTYIRFYSRISSKINYTWIITKYKVHYIIDELRKSVIFANRPTSR